MTEGNEHISALMDDDYDAHVMQRLLQDHSMQQTWSRYHLIGDCLRDTLPEKLSTDISERVHASLQSEPTVLAPAGTQRFNLKPVAGFAIAASVAMVAIFGIKQNSNNVVPAGPAIAENQSVQQVISPVATADTYIEPQIRPASVQTDTPASLANQRMSGYLVNYNEYRSSAGMHGIMPYVRIVTIETQE